MHAPAPPPRRRALSMPVAVLLLVLVCGALYGNTLHHPFILDDLDQVVNQPALQDVGDLGAIWRIQPTRFLSFLSLALNRHAHGLNLAGYHAVNIWIHILTSLSVLWLISLTLRTPALAGSVLARHRQLVSLAGALVFAAHPLQTQAVTYIVQRSASLAALCCVASLALYARARLTRLDGHRGIGTLLAAACCAAAAMFAKETAFTLPALLVLYELMFIRQSLLPSRSMLVAAALLAALVAGLLISMQPNFTQLSLHQQGDSIVELTPSTYLLTQLSVIVTYLRLLIVPAGQNLDYDFPLSHSLFEPATLACGAVLLVLLVAAIALIRRQRLLAFGMLWFGITLLPESSIIPISDVIFEHRLYLPMTGFAICCAVGIGYLACWRWRVALAALLLGAIVLGTLTVQRNALWRDPIVLWSDTIAKSPHKSRPWLARGNVYRKQGRLNEALADYNTAIRLNTRNYRALCNRGIVLHALGRYQQAITDYDAAAAIFPRSARIFYNRGLSQAMLERYADAAESFSRALAIDPSYGAALYDRGVTYGRLQQHEKAVADLSRVARISPREARIFYNRGLAYHALGKIDRAIADYSRALELQPTYLFALNNRGLLHLIKGTDELALKDFQRVLQIDPLFGPTHYNLSLYYRSQGDIRTAYSYLQKARALDAVRQGQ